MLFVFFSLQEPPCLSELERIQVLDGGKRRFGRYPHQSLSPLMVLSPRLLKRFFLSADDKQEAQINGRGLEPDTSANGRSSRHGPRVYVHVCDACANFFSDLAGGFLVRTLQGRGVSGVEADCQIFLCITLLSRLRNLVNVSF